MVDLESFAYQVADKVARKRVSLPRIYEFGKYEESALRTVASLGRIICIKLMTKKMLKYKKLSTNFPRSG